MSDRPKVLGVGRDASNERVLIVSFDRVPSDDDLRTFHEHARDWCRPPVFFHATPKADACDHEFAGWRTFEDGNGGERVCRKCGMGAMAYSLRTGP